MVNINAALPTTIATPFHPPTESLQRDNLIKPVIPKTEVIASYTKLRDQEEKAQFSEEGRSIIQDENEPTDSEANKEHQQQQFAAQNRRLKFFAKNSEEKQGSEAKALQIVQDLKLTISVIQEKYKRAVSPLPDPTIKYAL
ncbi:hypothetical protein CW745_16040 [Psychromonas sp. psych-6C06]|uniref:hypothetical protein n=1 Tax=Psychromonas sp. psych-6C06 TaxID=2058089 RepID=UPI000C33D665|nr:hypothetical protein [Psychromonas sp. psych-6C06]PKF60269.1 hypothetical protein CW745_16040 [Psychromonas sp. psych-6C06]